MDRRGCGRGRGRGIRQPCTPERGEGSVTGPNQNPRNEEGDQVATAINRITDVLECLVECQGPEPANQPKNQERGEDRALERFLKFAPPRFHGGSDPELAENWLERMVEIFAALDYAEESKPNHIEAECWRKKGKCLICGSVEHQISSCPSTSKEGGNTQQPARSASKQSNAEGSRPKVPARVYALDNQQILNPTEVVEGTISVFHRLAGVLIYPGATHSFIDPNFMKGVDVKCDFLPFDLEVKTPTGNQCLIANKVYRNWEIWIGERKLLTDLMSLAIKRYDVILGMDWLARYHAQLDCKMKLVELRIPGKATLKLNVKLENVPIVREFPDFFSEELETLPPERKIVFKIDVAPGTAPISKTPYRMALVELKELMLQLQDLLGRGFIRESD
nr:uncharacterized protein LOC113729108 [Coffea arabica]